MDSTSYTRRYLTCSLTLAGEPGKTSSKTPSSTNHKNSTLDISVIYLYRHRVGCILHEYRIVGTCTYYGNVMILTKQECSM